MADLSFSVIIPLYNKGNCISRAIESILKQTYQNFEILIVDDGSTDDGAIKVKAFQDSRIHLIQQQNFGVSVARNTGVQYSHNPYLCFLDADDLWAAGSSCLLM